jgi:hypothetical protein
MRAAVTRIEKLVVKAGTVLEPRRGGTFVVGSRYQATAKEG